MDLQAFPAVTVLAAQMSQQWVVAELVQQRQEQRLVVLLWRRLQAVAAV